MISSKETTKVLDNYFKEVYPHTLSQLHFFQSYKNLENTKILQIFHVAGGANIAFLSFQFTNILNAKDLLTPFLVISPFIFSFTALSFAYFSLYITDAANFYESCSKADAAFYKSKKGDLQKGDLVITDNIMQCDTDSKKYRDIAISGQLVCITSALSTYALFILGLVFLALPNVRHFLSTSPCFESFVLIAWIIVLMLGTIYLWKLFSKISNDKI